MNETLLNQALRLAIEAHVGQTDKAGNPYILHPLRVANAAAQAEDLGGLNPLDLFVVGLLHDVVEDTQITLNGLKEKLGLSEELLQAIDLLTFRKGEPKEAYWARIKQNPIALRVKLADIGDNADERRLKLLTDLNQAAKLRAKYAAAFQFLKG